MSPAYVTYVTENHLIDSIHLRRVKEVAGVDCGRPQRPVGSVSAGDVNGDGFDDVIVGALGSGSGASYVVFYLKAYDSVGQARASAARCAARRATLRSAIPGPSAAWRTSSQTRATTRSAMSRRW